MMSSFKIGLIGGLLLAVSSSLATAEPILFAQKEMVVTAINPAPIKGQHGQISFGKKCTVQTKTPLEKYDVDDLQIVMFVRGEPKEALVGQCPFATPFYMAVDEYIEMRLNPLKHAVDLWQKELASAISAAEKHYREAGMSREQLHAAIFLDPKVKDNRDGLRDAVAELEKEQAAIAAEKNLARRIASSSN